MSATTSTLTRRAYAEEGDSNNAVALTNRAAIIPDAASKLPRVIQFPLLILLNFSATLILSTFASEFTGNELSTVSRTLQDPLLVSIPVLWRIGEMAIGWYGGFDDYDMVSLSLMSRLPYYYFLSAYYNISAVTSALSLAVETAGAFLPFFLLRRRSLPHIRSGSKPNNVILRSYELELGTVALAASLFGLVVFASSKTWLPMHLVLHFDGIRSLEKVYNALHLELIYLYLPLGWAARTFLFAPAAVAAGAGRGLNAIRRSAFNPATATLSETFLHNIWGGFSSGYQVLLRRTFLLAALVGLSSWVRVWGAVDGSDSYGAAGWGAMWSAASVLVGLVLGWSAEL